MRILVLSDTHRSISRAVELMHDISRNIDAVVHLGDNTEDADFIKRNYKLPVYIIAGNCDYGSSAPHELVVKLGDKNVFMTHGHYYNVKYGTDTLVYRAQELGAQVCLFGHTHMPFTQVVNGITILNPGSLTMPRGGSKPSFGILKIENGHVYPIVVPYI